MARYVTYARVNEDDDSITAAVVFVADGEPVYSGLVDMIGRKLYRVPETVPLGFHRLQAGD